MAEINIERKPERSPWPIIIAVIALIAVAAAVWYYTQSGRVGAATPPTDATPAPVDTTLRTPPGAAAGVIPLYLARARSA